MFHAKCNPHVCTVWQMVSWTIVVGAASCRPSLFGGCEQFLLCHTLVGLHDRVPPTRSTVGEKGKKETSDSILKRKMSTLDYFQESFCLWSQELIILGFNRLKKSLNLVYFVSRDLLLLFKKKNLGLFSITN